MKHLSLFLLLSIALVFSGSKTRPAYRIFTGDKAKAIYFDKLMSGLKEADVVFFGENHNNSICHWLQLQVLKVLGDVTGKPVMIGAEMFEADAQIVLDEYLTGKIRQEHLETEAKVWKNYKTDYAPLVDWAKTNARPFIATNIPRRYASLVARNGLEALSDLDEEAKKYMAPLPIHVDYDLPSYREMEEMMFGHMGAHGTGKNMVDAQAIKDATMAHFIAKNYQTGTVFYHINGLFHSKNHEGIVYFLKQLLPGLNVITISIADQTSLQYLNEENIGLADYVIAIPDDMTKTY